MFNRKFLMCEPKHFRVSYSINPWMSLDKSGAVDHRLANEQWLELHHTIIRLGGYVEYVPPVPNLPDLCFTANAGLFHENKVVLSAFKYKERQGESEHFLKAFEKLGYEVLIPDLPFEGAGDAFVINKTLFLGAGFRTDKNTTLPIMDFLGLRSVVHCDLIDPYFYHLDTCFCPIGGNSIMYYPGAFSKATLDAFKSLNVFSFIEVDSDEARKFACNAVYIEDKTDKSVKGRHVILPADCPRTFKQLTEGGSVTPHAVRIDQFLKAGGAGKCLTLQMSEHR